MSERQASPVRRREGTEAQESDWRVGLGAAAGREALKDTRKRAIQGGRFGSGAWSELEAEGNGEGNFTRWICVRETQEQTTLQFFRIYS